MTLLPENILRLLGPEERKRVAGGQLTAAEALAKAGRRLERQEQRTLVNWLNLRTEEAVLSFNWSRTDRRTTNRMGTPDFVIFRDGRVLLGEMKAEGGELSAVQKAMHAELAACGCEVEIWRSADIAIRRVKNWLWTHWRLWNQQPEEGTSAPAEPPTA